MSENVNFGAFNSATFFILRAGDPKRALIPLTRACESLEAEDDDTPHMMRSNCYTKLGLYEQADEDADTVLNMNPNSVR